MGCWSRGQREGSTLYTTRTSEESQPRSREEAVDGKILSGIIRARWILTEGRPGRYDVNGGVSSFISYRGWGIFTKLTPNDSC